MSRKDWSQTKHDFRRDPDAVDTVRARLCDEERALDARGARLSFLWRRAGGADPVIRLFFLSDQAEAAAPYRRLAGKLLAETLANLPPGTVKNIRVDLRVGTSSDAAADGPYDVIVLLHDSARPNTLPAEEALRRIGKDHPRAERILAHLHQHGAEAPNADATIVLRYTPGETFFPASRILAKILVQRHEKQVKHAAALKQRILAGQRRARQMAAARALLGTFSGKAASARGQKPS